MLNKEITYDKKLITELGYKEVISKYNFANDSYNESLFYALSAMDKHIINFQKNNITPLNLLFGDYFSFEYYAKLKNNLQTLQKLTTIMEQNYIVLTKEHITIKDIIFLAKSFVGYLEFCYEKKLEHRDIKKLIVNFYKYYGATLTSKQISLELLEEEMRQLC